MWTKPILPLGDFAFAVINISPVGLPPKVIIKIADMDLRNPNGYNVSEVFEDRHVGIFYPDSEITLHVCPSCTFLGIARANPGTFPVLHNHTHPSHHIPGYRQPILIG